MLLSDAKLFAAPLFGRFEVRLPIGLLAPVAVGLVAIAVFRRAVSRVSWRALLTTTFVLAFAWIASLAASTGLEDVARPLESPAEQLAAVDAADSPLTFLRNFTDSIEDLPLHVQGHPPGGVLVLRGLAAVGLDGSGAAALAILVAAATAPLAALLAMRDVIDEGYARRAAPFLALVPAAVWIGTSMDALYMAVAAWGIALTVIAASPLVALSGGIVLGGALFLNYGIAPLALIPIVAASLRGRWRALPWAAAGAVLVFAAFAAAGFWWLDGLGATVERYRAGVSTDRPYSYFVVANVGAFALAVGPAAAAGLARVRERGVWLICAPALAAVLAADLSGLSKGEVERIWLPFVPWVLVAAGSLVSHDRRWLAAQVACALAIQIGVTTPW
jgi:methylthioxylose transferase